jgi:hypothetical protein
MSSSRGMTEGTDFIPEGATINRKIYKKIFVHLWEVLYPMQLKL